MTPLDVPFRNNRSMAAELVFIVRILFQSTLDAKEVVLGIKASFRPRYAFTTSNVSQNLL